MNVYPNSDIFEMATSLLYYCINSMTLHLHPLGSFSLFLTIIDCNSYMHDKREIRRDPSCRRKNMRIYFNF